MKTIQSLVLTAIALATSACASNAVKQQPAAASSEAQPTYWALVASSTEARQPATPTEPLPLQTLQGCTLIRVEPENRNIEPEQKTQGLGQFFRQVRPAGLRDLNMLVAIAWRAAVPGSDHSEPALKCLRMPAHTRVTLQIGETQY